MDLWVAYRTVVLARLGRCVRKSSLSPGPIFTGAATASIMSAGIHRIAALMARQVNGDTPHGVSG